MPNGWTPDQIKQFQDYWDTEFAGDLARRRRAKFVPGDTASRIHETKEPEHKNDFDEWLARIICYAFSVPPQWAVKAMNRATADNQSAQAEDEGLEPTKAGVKDLIDEIIADEFASPDLELAWLDEDEADPKGLEAVLEGRVKIGAVTLNEMRDALGLDPYDNPAADRPMVLTASGYVPIEVSAGDEKARGAKGRELDEEAIGDVNARERLTVLKYSSDQRRVPAGNPDGGQWTKGDESGALVQEPGQPSAVSPEIAGTRVRYADLEAVSQTDAAPTPKMGRQYAAGAEEDEETGVENRRINGRLVELSPGQEIRLDSAWNRRQEAVSRVHAIDPTWQPSAGVYETIEGQIADYESQAREAEEYLSRHGDKEKAPDLPDLARTGNPAIDSATKTLMRILGDVLNKVGSRPDLSPQQYGTLVHRLFAENVRAAGLDGIEAIDVERTFGLKPDAPYGSRSSVRPDVLWRNDDGDIGAIYDAKTRTTRLWPWRARQFRRRTGAPSDTPVIELHNLRGPSLKYRAMQWNLKSSWLHGC